jgi:hypothetical protein
MTRATAPIVLTDRDKQLLEYMFRFRLLNRDQIMALAHFNSLTRANTRLAKLVKARLLSRKQTPVVPGHGGAQALYHLAPASVGVLNADPSAIIAQSRQASRWDLRQMDHVITANQVLVDFLSAVNRLPETQMLSFRTEPELRRAFLAQPLVPDGWFAWTDQGKRFNCFIEVDLAHEGLTQWRKKVLDYLTYAESGLHQEVFSFRSFRVLVIALGARRLDGLRRTSEHADRFFLFAQLGEINAQTILGAAWLPVLGSDRVSLTGGPSK